MDQAVASPQTLTLQEVCERLRSTRRTALTLITRGDLTAFKVGVAWRSEARDVQSSSERQKRAMQRARSEGDVV